MSGRFTHAIVRKPGANCAQGLTTAKLGEPSFDLVLAQHKAYTEALSALGLHVIVLEAEPDYPDAYFCEDTAVVTPDVAVITNPGAVSRRGEVDTIEPVLARYRPTTRIRPPGTVDGGDVLMIDRHFLIGLSERTNREGAEQLGQILESYGCTWTAIPVGKGLHLKSSVNYIGRDILLVSNDFAERDEIKWFDKVVVDDNESYAANTLWVNDCLFVARGFPKTRRQLEGRDFKVQELDVSEMRKMDGGLTCLSLRF
jgi:dimethylargininase